MDLYQGDYFNIPAAKFGAIAALAEARYGITEEKVKELLLETDWPEGREHEDWLFAAPLGEIVSWLHEVNNPA